MAYTELSVAEQAFLAEVSRCRKDFKYFCKAILRIEFLEKNKTRVIPLKPNPAQILALDSILKNRTTYVLKARRLGISTIVLAYFYWKILFNKGYKTATLAHTNEAAEEIFKAVRAFHAHMPEAWKVLFPLSTDSADTIAIKNGGSYRIGSARSQGFRGSGLNILHLSEFALYPNIDVTLESVAATLPPGASTIWETTPQGLNRAYEIWMGDSKKDGISRVFFPWTMEPRYRSTEPPPSIPEEMAEYRRQHTLDDEQFYWACWTYIQNYPGNLTGFNREYPINPTVAFVVSGERIWPHLVYPQALHQQFTGHKTYQEPKEYHMYSAGADPAGGGPKGDFSALTILDCTNKDTPQIVHTFYDRIITPEFSREVYNACLKYKAVLAVERNNHGNEIINRLIEMNYPYLYTIERVDTAKKWTKVIGFNTTETGRNLLIGLLHQFLGTRALDPIDTRLQLEINTFEYIMKNGRIREEARSGAHDDMLFSLALALEAMGQTYRSERATNAERPTSFSEIFQWQKVHRKKYNPDDPMFERDYIDSSNNRDSGRPIASIFDRRE